MPKTDFEMRGNLTKEMARHGFIWKDAGKTKGCKTFCTT